MKISTLEYFIREALISLKRNSFMSIASISTVALSLLTLGIFLIMVLNLNHIASIFENQVQILVYLQDDLSESEINELKNKIAKIPGVTQLDFVDKEEALKRFKDRLGEQKGLLTALGDTNPLPNSFEVKVDNPDHIISASEAISGMQGIENTNFGQDIIDKLFSFTKFIRYFGFMLIIFLSFVALFIISNTTRITVFARRQEIGIMKYVGATDWFIRWPFLIEGIILGFCGSLFAVLVLNRAYITISEQIYEVLAFLPLLPKYPFLTNVSIFLIVTGTVIGALGSTISLKRFMKV